MRNFFMMLALSTILLSLNAVLAEEISENITDKKDPPYLDEVVVTATRSESLLIDTPDVVQVITREEIDELNPSSTGEIMEYITGVSVETGTGSGLPKRSIIGLNGLPANYTLVLVDGVRLLTEHIHTGQNIELIPPQTIERIEITRGSSSAQYGGDAIGGIVNIITRKATDAPEFSLGAAIGDYDTYEGEATLLTPLTKKSKIAMFVKGEQSDGVPLIAPAHRIDNMGYEQVSVYSRLDIDLLESSHMFGVINYADLSMDWIGDEADSSLRTVVLGGSHRFSNDVDWTLKVSHSEWDAEISNELNKLFQPEMFFSWPIHDNHIITGGVDYKQHEFTRTAVVESEQDTVGAFMQHEWMYGEILTLLMSLRLDDVEDIDTVISPKLSLIYSPIDPMRFRFSAARGFHAPTPQELYEQGYGHGGRAYRFGNPDLDPEYSTTVSAGVEIMPASSFQISIYGYYSDIEDMIVPVYQGPWDLNPEIDVWMRMNIEEATVYGGEINARYTLKENLKVECGYTYTDNEDKSSGRQLPYHPGSALYLKVIPEKSISSDWKLSGFAGLKAVFDRSAWNWKPESNAPVDDPSGLITELDDYEKLDAGISLTYRNKYQIFANAYNILGQDIENLDDVYTVLDGEPVVKVGFRCVW